MRDNSGSNNPMYGKKHSEETRQKIREKALGRKFTAEQRKKFSDASKTKRKVVQLDKKGNVVNTFLSVREAADSVNLANTNIVFCCRHEWRTARGYYWRYADETD